jgi:tRNA dimethylallyltransferase
MKKLLVVCGPTATGKSSLGFSLARMFNGEIVSADSRQVYSGMDIGTGKEWKRGIKIWGYDLVEPKKEFSVSKYLKYSKKVLRDVWKRGKLPILVGGTGLYIRGVVDGIPTSTIPRNEKLREKLEEKSADELFESLSQLDSIRAGSMNSSDRKNPRRLVRAIEIAQWKLEHGSPDKLQVSTVSPSVLMIGLSEDSELLDKRINSRVEERIKAGVKEEVEGLIKSGVGWDSQAMLALGYRQWRDYFEGGVEEDVVVDEWKREERKYARRQMTWFKKDKRIIWFDISMSEYQKGVEKLVKKWYSTPDAKKG